MKKISSTLLLCLLVQLAISQTDKEKIEKACLNYIEGFYEGDTLKLIQSLQPTLHKIGYWKNDKTNQYEYDGQMTYRQAIDYAKRVNAKKAFAKPGSVKKVELLNIGNTIAAAKVTAHWGIDYVLLSKQNDSWMIEEVLWEGPLSK